MTVNFKNTQKQELYKDFNRSVTNPVSNQVKNQTKLLDADSSNLAQLKEDKVELSTTSSKNAKNSANNSNISTADRLTGFAKSIVSPITNTCKSSKDLAKPLQLSDEEALERISQMESDPEIENLSYDYMVGEFDMFDWQDFQRDKPQLYKDIILDDKTVVRKTQLLNRTTGEYEDAYILRDNKIPNKYSISTDKESLGKMIIKDGNHLGGTGLNADLNPADLINASEEYQSGNFTEIYKLETTNEGQNASNYRGTGTELVKQAMIESYKSGHSGRVSLIAANWTLTGADAEGFYSHLGMDNVGPDDTSLYAFDENKIANFLFN